MDKDRQAFILWGDGFEAPVATLIAARLRQRGVSVKIVGVHGASGIDMNGIRLQADATLGDALNIAHHALAVIIPCSASRLKKAENDPRLFRFFKQTIAPQTIVVVRSMDVLMQASLVEIAAAEQYMLYEDANEQLPLAEALANRLGL